MPRRIDDDEDNDDKKEGTSPWGMDNSSTEERREDAKWLDGREERKSSYTDAGAVETGVPVSLGLHQIATLPSTNNYYSCSTTGR